MPLVDDFQVLELMLLVLISEHGTVTAYRFSTRVTIVIQLRLVLWTHFFAVIGTWTIILESLNYIRDLFEYAEVDKLGNSK